METIKVDVRQGVYLHLQTGNFFTVEFGELRNSKTKAILPVIKTIGTNILGEEVERIVSLAGDNETLLLFANVINGSEYLGEL